MSGARRPSYLLTLFKIYGLTVSNDQAEEANGSIPYWKGFVPDSM